MKTTIALTGLMMWSAALMAQVEHDDMYFRKKDRAKLNQQKESVQEQNAQAIARGEKKLRFDYPINTNQSIPAQSNQTNPEYISRSQSETVATEDQNYFIDHYQFNPRNSYNNFGNQFDNWNANPMYYNGFIPPLGFRRYHAPYSPFNDPFFMGNCPNPWMNQSFNSGWAMQFNYGWGGSYLNYGWGNTYTRWSLMFGNPGWGLYSPFYGPYYGNGFFYSPRVVIIDNDGRNNAVYGKRSSRSQNQAYSNNLNTAPKSSRSTSTNTTVTNNSGSNVRQSRSGSSEYYTPQWRRVTQQSNTTYQNSSQGRVNSGSDAMFNNRSSSGSQQQRSSYSAPVQRSSGGNTMSSPSRGSGGGSSPSRSSRGGN